MKKNVGIIIGVAIFVLAVVGMFVVSRIINPPSQEIIVAVTDLESGDMLSPDVVQVVSVKMSQVQLANYLRPSILEDKGYVVQVLQFIPDGNFIPLDSLLFADNPAAMDRVALGLEDPNLVAMVIPVTPLTCPPDIKPGDRVDITMDIGSSSFMTGTFSAAPTSEAYSPYSSSRPNVTGDEGTIPTLQNPMLSPLPTSTKEAAITLPVSKTITRAEVLKVIYEMRLAGTMSDDSQAERGDILGIVVAVNADAQEAIGFAIHNGEVRVAVLSPNAGDEAVTAGMSWEDIVQYFKWNRMLWLMDTESIQMEDAPGAAVKYPTLVATYFPSPTPRPTNTPTLTPTGTVEGEQQPTLGPTPTP